jgi:hypothetical protein
MMVYVNPTPSKRRKTTRARKPRVPFVPLQVSSNRKAESQIPSAPIGKYVPPKDLSYQREVSSKYTVAIAYNKGAYQVISPENVKDIGR